MIITKLVGGLGNQMFQYAIGRNLAKKNNTNLKLDLSFYNEQQTDSKRNYSLKYFNILENIATEEEIKKLRRNECKNGRRHLLHNLFFANKSIYIKEKQFNFDKNVLNASNNFYLSGYWQSEKYFKNIEDIIRKEFTLKTNSKQSLEELTEKIKKSNSISLHVRRGDYANNPNTRSHHGLCPIEFYEEAIKIATEKYSDIHLFVFSDDIEWVKENLKTDSPTIFVEDNKDYEDLILMSKCKHNIITNSSFSWWGAWLNQNPNKIVIAPKKWFNDPKTNTEDLIPKSWIQI